MRQKTRVEGSICESYIEEEASFFLSRHFSDHVNISFESATRNDEGTDQDDCQATLFIFLKPGRPAGNCVEVWLDDRDYHVAHTYILLNCAEVAPFVR